MHNLKILILPVILILTACNTVGGAKRSANIAPLSVSFANPSEWTGDKIPNSGICSNDGGKDKAPSLIIKGIPNGTNSILMKYSDKDSINYDNGGHGTIGYKTSDTSTVTIPGIYGERLKLPAPFYAVTKHRSTRRANQGIYLAPCSGGSAHLYSVQVYAVNRIGNESTILGEGSLKLGRH